MEPQRPSASHKRASSVSSTETVKVESLLGVPRIESLGKAKNCSVWIHDENYAKEDVLLDLDLLGKGVIRPGDLVEVKAGTTASEARDFQITADKGSRNSSTTNVVSAHAKTDSAAPQAKQSPKARRARRSTGGQEQNVTRYVFVAKAIPDEVKSRATGLQISLTSTIANAFGFRSRDPVTVSLADRQDHTASHVEVVFRDIYLARADMWRLLLSDLCEKTVYKGQKLLFLGTIKATIKAIYVHGKRVSSAYFSASTIPIYRSESARYVLFIQMSREMWNFDSEGTGEILFSKVIDGFLPELFKRWADLEARHLVTIVMFARLEYDRQQLLSLGQLHSADLHTSQFDSGRTKYKDFYRVVVTDMASGSWTVILNALKREFRVFLRDISIQETAFVKNPEGEKLEVVTTEKPRICGRPSLALRGNILEAINIAASQFGRDHIDRDLVRTGISVVLITPGPGVFEVDRDLLHLTSENMTNNGMGIDLVCLSRMPLHSVPLFKYRGSPISRSNNGVRGGLHSSEKTLLSHLNATGPATSPSVTQLLSTTPRSASALRKAHDGSTWFYGIPQWIDVSFWSAAPDNDILFGSWNSSRSTYLDTRYTKSFVPQARMYALQMMGVMETGLANISIPYLSEGPQGIQQVARRVNSTRNLNMKRSYRHLATLSSSNPNQPAFPNQGESPQSTRDGARVLVEAHNRSTKYKLERMDHYDQRLFQMQPRLRKAANKSRSKHVNAESVSRIKTRPQRTGSQSSTLAASSTASRPGTSGTDKASVRPETPSRPKMATPQKLPSSRMTRSISFALRGLGTAPPRALASTSVIAENISAAGLSKGDSSNSKLGQPPGIMSPDIGRSKKLEQLPAESDGSDHSDSSRSTMQKADGKQSPSRPITIRRSSRVLGQLQRLPEDVANSFSTTTTKVEEDREMDQATIERTIPEEPILRPESPEQEEAEAAAPQAQLIETVSPWVKNVNPFNPNKNHPDATSSFGRWQHIFPRAPRAATMKWRSLCTPASVPLTTEVFPKRQELEYEYSQTPYVVQQESDSALLEVPKTRETLVKEMIGLRLSHGYQVVVGSALADATGTDITDASQLSDIGKLAEDGNMLFMSMGNTIQRLVFSNEKEIHVTKFVRKDGDVMQKPYQEYAPSIRTILSTSYVPRILTIGGYSEEYPWSQADAFLAGQREYNPHRIDQLRWWRARFVLIPIDPPPNARRGMQINIHDTAEEIHLTGIKILSQTWQKLRHLPEEERVVKIRVGKRKDPNPLDIMFETRNPSEVVAGELDRLLEADENGGARPTQLLPESELFQRERFSLPHLAQVIQGERGVEIVTRRWHLRLHYNCFIGSDFTTWLHQNFKEIESREEAVELGNELMTRKLFQHVEQRHNFRDGNYFYQIAPEYRASRPESRASWFSSGRKTERGSIPSTPMPENAGKDSPISARSRSNSRSNSANVDAAAKESPTTTPTKPAKPRHSISLSKVMQIDVDHRKRSNRPEIVELHYDRIHNPENCYHLELSWFNVTSKLVEDAIVQWATSSERYGLKLVEVPIYEISSISEREPFRSPYHVYLSVSPPASRPVQTYFNASSLTPQQGEPDRYYYQRMILKKFNFVLDLEAATDFPPDVQVTYSWGRPDYRYSQYIHKSGILLVQIAEDGHFLLLANRLYNTRSASSKDGGPASKNEAPSRHERRPPLPSASAHPTQLQTATLSTSTTTNMAPSPNPHLTPLSPHPSPLVRASADVLPSREGLSASIAQGHITPEDIKDILEVFCSDTARLEEFYKETATPPPPAVTTGGRATGRLAAVTPLTMEERQDVDGGGLDSSIPSLVLPASVVENPGIGLGMRSTPSLRRISPQNNNNNTNGLNTPTDPLPTTPSPSAPAPIDQQQRPHHPSRRSSSSRDLKPSGPSPASAPVSASASSSTTSLPVPSSPRPPLPASSPLATTSTSSAATEDTAAQKDKDNPATEREDKGKDVKDGREGRRRSVQLHHFPPSPAISAISAAIENSPQLLVGDVRGGGGGGGGATEGREYKSGL